jgi:hypothetical protein
MRLFPALLLVLAVIVTAGCVEDMSSTTPVTTAPVQTPVTTTVVLTSTPVPTPTPDQVAYVSNIKCGTGDKWGKDYHCDGDMRIRSGPSHEVQVISRYPDKNIFQSNSEDLGGSNAISKPFIIFPDLKYQGQTPEYFVRIDSTLYPVISGVAWSNTPGAEGIIIP